MVDPLSIIWTSPSAAWDAKSGAVTQPPPPPQQDVLSADGQWRWDGSQLLANQPIRPSQPVQPRDSRGIGCLFSLVASGLLNSLLH
jgi:hypothetical protein